VKIVTGFPRRVREVEHCWIPLSDGCRLAARLWLPDDAEASPVPAILEYLPYRKRDLTRARDEPMHRYLAGHGYAAVRVDVRGTGESDGLFLDEYAEQEIADGVEVIRWLAARPWCTGAVGMMGKSYGGFNALQVAARRPPALRAIIVVCASDDRYADDAHYMGGCLLSENLVWGTALLGLTALPPDPALVGAGWRERWRTRLERAVLHPETWLRHQWRDDYWRHGSVCEDLGRIACPVYAIGGWADAYSNAIPRLVAALGSPSKGLVGPWAHLYPHQGLPGPAVGFLQEALRWWDRWLKGLATGVTQEPRYRVWMQESARPRPFHALRPGRWVAEDSWPSPRITPRRWVLAPGRLVDVPGPEIRLDHRSPETVGLAAGAWCDFGVAGDAPADQRPDDAGSLTFDSEPLCERLEILGAPTAVLALAVDRPAAFIAVRLNEVFPDGASARVSYGLLNLTHRMGHERSEPLEPGRRYVVCIRLRDVGHAFAAGSRLRVAMSSAYWPIAWPAPEPVTLGVFTGKSHLELPVRPARAEDARLEPLAEPEGAPPLAETVLRPARAERTIAAGAAGGETLCTVLNEGSGFGSGARSRLAAIDLEFEHAVVERYAIRGDDPLSARAEIVQTTTLARPGWRVRVETEARLSATRDAFALEARLDAFEGDTRIAARSWDRRIPRDGI
jgi:hypothetical protein